MVGQILGQILLKLMEKKKLQSAPTISSILMSFVNNFNYLSPQESNTWILKFIQIQED